MPISDVVKSAIKSNKPDMTHLLLCHAGLSDKDIAELCTLLKDNTYIISLNLSYNNIGKSSATYLATILHRITQIDLQNNNLDSSAVISLLSVIPSTLKQLDVSNNNLKDDRLDELLKVIGSSRCKLKYVGNSFSKHAESKIADAVSKAVLLDAKSQRTSPHVKLSAFPPPLAPARDADPAGSTPGHKSIAALSQS